VRASPAPEASSRRVAILAGTGRYDHPDEWDELDQIETALDTVAGCLDGLGYRPAKTASYLLNPTKDELGNLFHSTPADAEVVIAYYTGHGHVDGLHYLVTRDSTVRAPEFITSSAIPTRELPSLLAVRDPNSGRWSRPQPYLLIIVDTCFSGAGANQITRDQLSEVVDPDRTWVLVSARPTEYAQQGAFPAALRRALTDSTAGQTQPYVHPDVLVGSINSQLPKWQRVRSHPPASGVEEPPPFFPNPGYQPVPAGLTLADQAHWVSRLRGTAEPAAGYYITGGEGRTAAVREIADWISDPDRGAVAVVTGRPGSGKSALLALPALVTDPAYRESLLAAAGDRPIVRAATMVRPGTRVIAVHGRGLNADQLARAIAAGLGRDADTVDGLLDALEREPARDYPVVLLDALDETEQPGVVVRQLVTELARRGLRVLIGTREHLLKTIASPSLVVDLDKEPFADATALTDYITQLLVASHEPGVTTPYQPLQRRVDETLATIAAAVNTKAAGSFLIGQLIALALRGRDQVVGTEHLDDIPASVGEAFDADLARLGGWSARARVLLTALAWAKGPGLPWENVWVPVVNSIRPALATRTPEPLHDDDVRRLRDEAGAYIVEDTGPGGRAVFRPFHDLLAAHLRASGEAPGRETVSVGHVERINGLVTDALMAGVPTDETRARLWTQAHPYLRSYLAQHAADAGADRMTALLAGGPGYLAAADPATLVPLLLRKQLPGLSETLSVYRRATPFLGANVDWNAAYLQEAAVALGARSLSETFAADRLAPAFDTVIANERADASLLAFTGHSGLGVKALAAVPLPGGPTLLASGGYDGPVRLWDPVTSQPAGPPLEGHRSSVVALAAIPMPGGPTLLATGADDGTVRLWDPATGQPTGPELGPELGSDTGPVALAVVPLAGGPILLAAGHLHGRVKLWNPATGQPAGPPLQDYARPAEALTAVPLPGGPTLLAAGDRDGWVWLWDVATGWLAGSPEHHTGSVEALAAVPLPGGSALLAIGSGDGTILLWDLSIVKRGLWRRWRPGRPAGPPLEGHTGPVEALAAVPLPGGPTLLASGSGDGTIRLWDPATRQPAGPPLGGHTGPVEALAAVPLPGGPTLLAAGHGDGTIRLWDPATRQPAGPQLGGHTGPVEALAVVPLPGGPTLLAAGHGDGTIRLWDPATGQPAGPPLEGHTYSVEALAVVPLPGGPTLLAAGSDHGTVRVWDPATGQPAGPPLEGHTYPVVALAVVPLPGGPTLLAAGHGDGTVRVWDPVNGRFIARIACRAAVLTLLGWSDSLIAIGSADGLTVIALASLLRSQRGQA
jgi:WD40 repeat protein